MKELNSIVLIIIILCISVFYSCKVNLGVEANSHDENSFNERGDYRIMFYNIENLFDTFDDSLTNDEEFLPDGVRHWNNTKYYKKLNNIYKVIVAVGGWQPPEIIGLCEIENRTVLDDLVKKTPLSTYNYQIVHAESPDRRGIDVALLFLKDRFIVLKKEFIRINYPDNSGTTRDILYVKGITYKSDTLHIFVNHWPSRWGGQMESEDRRLFVAKTLRNKLDSIIASNEKSNIIITGDFNDEPDNKSLTETLRARKTYENISDSILYNLSFHLYEDKGMGSHKYQGNWGVLDQFIVSGTLLKRKNSIHTTINNVYIFKPDFLLEKDEANAGFKPFRTYLGYKYNEGFSDHLPTYLDIFKKNN
ncbi:MAG: endonuclease [Bacteroidota bacterium]